MADVPGVTMSLNPPETLQRVRMSWEQYLALPHPPISEWVDGVVLMNAPVSPDHSWGSYGLTTALRRLTDCFVFQEVGLLLPQRVRVPDVMVVTERPDSKAVSPNPWRRPSRPARTLAALPMLERRPVCPRTGAWPSHALDDVDIHRGLGDTAKMTDQVPVLVAEVLSSDTASIDLVDKWEEYAAFGIAHYWVLDPDRRTLRLNRLVDGEWEETDLLDADNNTAVVTIGDHGSVRLDLEEILSG